jgi:hypothetical protein
VQHGKEADPGTEMLGVFCYSEQGLSDGTKEQAIEEPLVLKSQVADSGRQCENDMEVGHIEQVFLPGIKPPGCGRALALGAMAIAAGVIGDLLMPTPITSSSVAAQSRGATQ